SIAARHPSAASVRFANVLHPDEGDLLVRQISSRIGVAIAGHDPVAQFISVEDSARALAAAAESRATGIFNAAGDGVVPLKKAYRASRANRLALAKPLAQMFTGRGSSVDQLQYNWTVSGARAAKELGFHPEQTSVEALEAFLKSPAGSLRESY